MKKTIIILTIGVAFLMNSCDFLSIEPEDMISPEDAFKNPSSVKSAMATLYLKIPVEDFNYNPMGGGTMPPGYGFNFRDGHPGFSTSFYTDESLHSAGTYAIRNIQPVAGYWDYEGIRNVNTMIETLPTIEGLSEDDLNKYLSECHFIRAYMYFALARRYGGVPLIMHVQESTEDLFVPRSTEKETWNFVLEECDKAIAHLPTTWAGLGEKRATVWAAYALKSRAALHAASVAKYWNNAQLIGEAVEEKLVGGMTSADAEEWYKQCIEASTKIIDESGKSLYRPSPANPGEAATNYQRMFERPEDAAIEVIFSKGYTDGTTTLRQGHSMDVYFQPAQTRTSFHMWGRFSPTLDLVDLYEDYTDDGTGSSAKLITRTGSASEDEYILDPGNMTSSSFLEYKKYDDPADIFKDKDARLHASILYGGSSWKSANIVMQAGYLAPDGTPTIYKTGNINVGGNTYYAYGGATPDQYSGFADLGLGGNFSCTGFSLRKFLNEANTVEGKVLSSTIEFIDFRLAEIYLNYAEAALESSHGDRTKAAQYLNFIRKRAGHTDNIPLTLSNVLKERRIELAFEGHRYWDLVRRREYHTEFNGRIRKSLVPVLDLTESTPKYVFVRANNYYDNDVNGMTFYNHFYYLPIPGISTNNLVQNPQY